MATPRSPFLVVQNFLSPKVCEAIVDDLGYYTPDTNSDGEPIKMVKHHEPSEDTIFERFQPLVPYIENYYEVSYKGTERMLFEFYAEGTVSAPLCENSSHVKKKWIRTKDRDITCVLFLSEYNGDPPFDSDYEVYGGKLEFPQHGFGFNPQRGTLIIYPSSPHFINANAEVVYGDLYQVRFHVATNLPFMYDPSKFPGNYQNWFKHLR